MFTDPEPTSQIQIDLKTYTFVEVPNVPGIVYAEIGRRAKVYRLSHDDHFYALKVFKPKYRNAQTVANTNLIQRYSTVAGLSVARRTILYPDRYPDIIAEHPDFAYAVLMPWIEGDTWLNYISHHKALERSDSLKLARSLVDVLVEMERRTLAHCDLSSSNFIFSSDLAHIELIDLEEMFGEGLLRPEPLPAGTSGYSPAWVRAAGNWEAGADRFAVGILLSEILVWQYPEIQELSAGDAFFAEDEFGHKSKRFRAVSDRLKEIRPELSRLFELNWYAEGVEDCPRIADWQAALEATREPVLSVEPARLHFGTLDGSALSAELSRSLIVTNTGGSVLTGQAVSAYPWLKISPEKFALFEGQSHEYTLSLGSDAPQQKGQREHSWNEAVVVHSNVGEKKVAVYYNVPAKKEKPLLVWILTFIFLGGLLGVASGSLILSNLINTPSPEEAGVAAPIYAPATNTIIPSPTNTDIPATDTPIPPTDTPIITPTLSLLSLPSGQLAYFSYQPPFDVIYLMNLDGTKLSKLTDDSKNPVWSPDGMEIAYVYGLSDIRVMNADGTSHRQITNLGIEMYPSSWSKDGIKIAFNMITNGNLDVWSVNQDGSGLTPITFAESNETAPDWSPDGKKILFSSDEGGNLGLYILDLETGEQTLLTPDIFSLYSPARWSPDGERIVFQAADLSLKIISLTDSTVLPITSGNDSKPSWSPDGEWIVFNRFGDSVDIWLVKSDGTYLKQITNDPSNEEYPQWRPIPSDTEMTRIEYTPTSEDQTGPPAPKPLQPVGNYYCNSSKDSILFKWEESYDPSGISNYTIALEGCFGSPCSFTVINYYSEDNDKSINLACNGMPYKWRVYARDNAGNPGIPSAWISFRPRY